MTVSSTVTFFPIPTAGTTEGTANFSIPVDEFAWVHMSVTATMDNGIRSAGSASDGGGVVSSNSGGIWLDEGDTVSTSASAGSSTTAVVNTFVTATSTASVLVNATAVLQAQARARQGTPGAGSFSSGASSVDGTADARYGISRFDK